ncbi:MAG TPA: peptide chain release factor N(5)-glutamine methyltransferase [bacterium]|nr:peptide chain release factor N(5)-glutamine methyltransferase [bacterium]
MKYSRFLHRAICELRESGSSTPELDARLILEETTRYDDTYMLTHPDFPITNSQLTHANKLLSRRLKGEPIAYLTGHKEFYGLDFYVNKNVLVPRPESEWLVGESISYVVSRIKKKSTEIRNTKYAILDVGTGSGCIIISVAKTLYSKYCIQNLKYYATDISKKTLYVAKKNEKHHDIQPLIRFYHSDLFSNSRLPKKFDIIIANLPYVPLDTRYSIPDTLKFEPKNAIFAQDNGTAIIKRFLAEAKHHLEPDGIILIELDPRNASVLLDFAKHQYPKSKIELSKDLAGFDRYISIST